MSIRLPLEKAWKLGLFASISLILGGALISQTFVVAGSEELGRSGSLPRLQEAAVLWPDNPEVHYQLGLLALYTFGSVNRVEARTEMRRATQLSPLRTNYWRGLAWACESASDEKCANIATERVRTLAPMDPDAVWFTGNYYLRSHQPDLAMERFAHLLKSTPEYDKYIFRICDSLGCPEAAAKRLFTQSGPQVELDYISYLATRGDVDAAQVLWSSFPASAMRQNFSLPVDAIEPLVDSLLQRGQGKKAAKVWNELEKLGIVHGDQSADGNLVFNGDFEDPSIGSGLDWQKPDTRYVTVDLTAGGAYRGKRCMRIDFTVNRNDSYFLAYQLVPLDPNGRYVLTAYVRSEDITSDSGPQIGVFDPLCPSCLRVSSEPIVGTTLWHRIELKFSTGPTTELARLQVWRSPSRTYPMDITGVFWLDRVEIKRVREDTERPAESSKITRSPGPMN